MKKMNFSLLLMLCITVCMGQQLKLQGTMIGSAMGDSIEVNNSYDGNYWKNNSRYLVPDASGNFKTTYTSSVPKLITLIYKNRKQQLLLSPGRSLQVVVHTDSQGIFLSFKGSAKAENDLIQKLRLDDEEHLPFVKELRLQRSYATWSVDSVISIKFPKFKAEIEHANRVVEKAHLPINIAKIIQAELTFSYANAICQNLGNLLNNRTNRNDFHTQFIDAVCSYFALPNENELSTGVSANAYLENYFKLQMWKVMYVYRNDQHKEHADSTFKKVTGASYREMENDPDRSNEVYLFATHMRNLIPRYAWERYLTQLLHRFSMSGQLQTATKLFNFIKVNCTDTGYLKASEEMFAPLRKASNQYAGNLNIKIRSDYRTVSSLDALLSPYRGKVVLIDFWGTWCPHCIKEFAFYPELKTRLQGKDVVFLYIARDEDKDDEVWRDFILINNLSGEHVRKTAGQISKLWNEFGVADNNQSYPYYLIVDRSGKVLINDAKRPADVDGLTSQIEKALDK